MSTDAPAPPRLKTHGITIDMANFAANPLPALCELLSLAYGLGARHGGAVINSEVRTNPLQPTAAKLVINTDVPLEAATLMELQQMLLSEYQCDEHDEPVDGCETCAARVLIAVTMPREVAAVASPDPEELQRQHLRNQILAR